MKATGYLIRPNESYRGRGKHPVLYEDHSGIERVAHTGRPKVVQISGDMELVISEGTPDVTVPEYEASVGQSFLRVSLEEA